MSLTIGSKGRAEALVTEANTAAAVGSGLVPVFATPYMIALMENAAVNAVQTGLEPGQGTVGTRLEVTHDAATPVGMKVWAEAELTALEGKKLTFAVPSSGPRSGRMSINIPLVSDSVRGTWSSTSMPSMPSSSSMLLTRSTASVVVFRVNFFHFIFIFLFSLSAGIP